jgi:hypothetical protein
MHFCIIQSPVLKENMFFKGRIRVLREAGEE